MMEDSKELDKIEYYHDLAQEFRKMWNMKVKVIPLVKGALWAIPIKLRNWLKEIGIETQLIELQKTVLLKTTQILRKGLEV